MNNNFNFDPVGMDDLDALALELECAEENSEHSTDDLLDFVHHVAHSRTEYGLDTDTLRGMINDAREIIGLEKL